jgi:hypothetical protein
MVGRPSTVVSADVDGSGVSDLVRSHQNPPVRAWRPPWCPAVRRGRRRSDRLRRTHGRCDCRPRSACPAFRDDRACLAAPRCRWWGASSCAGACSNWRRRSRSWHRWRSLRTGWRWRHSAVRLAGSAHRILRHGPRRMSGRCVACCSCGVDRDDRSGGGPGRGPPTNVGCGPRWVGASVARR